MWSISEMFHFSKVRDLQFLAAKAYSDSSEYSAVGYFAPDQTLHVHTILHVNPTAADAD